MEKRSEYVIQFAGLPNGLHNYDYHITDLFFKRYAESLINKADVKLEVLLMKGLHNLQLTFNFSGIIHVTCVRCLDEFDIAFNEKHHLVIRQVEELPEVEEDDEVVSIPMTDHEFDLSPHIYDYIHLAVPLNPVHPDDKKGNSTCNSKAIDEMNKHLDNRDNNPDPRWDILKNLKLK